jgi:RNA polymerase sigma-70 factor (ECF subfamily)
VTEQGGFLPDEATLLEQVRQCDRVALAQVYDEYYERIYRYVYRYIGRVGTAEDLTANVFFRLLRAVREGNSPRNNLSAWLYRVAHNLVVDSFRRTPPEELELVEWLESDEPDPALSAEQRLQLARVRSALCHLTEGQQQVIVFKFFQGMDSREIAQVMGKTEGAVDALQHRGLRALRKLLKQQAGPGATGDAGGRLSCGEEKRTRVGRDSSTAMPDAQALCHLLYLLFLVWKPLGRELACRRAGAANRLNRSCGQVREWQRV